MDCKRISWRGSEAAPLVAFSAAPGEGQGENPVFAQVDISASLATRAAPPPDLAAEIDAMHALAREMAAARPRDAIIGRLIEAGLALCGAESGGISLYEAAPPGPGVFRWHGVRGRFAALAGSTVPREGSPSGLAVDRLAPVLLAAPERLYPFLDSDELRMSECLVVPLIGRQGAAVGTVWIASHDGRRLFTQTDADVMTRLAAFAALGLTLTGALAEQTELLQRTEMLVREVDHRVANSLQLVASMLRVQASQEDERVRERLARAAMRIGSVKHVHERLARAGGDIDVDAGQYLRSLCGDLSETVRAEGGPTAFDVLVESDPVALPADAMTKVGLIVTELVTNAFKHCGAPATCTIRVEIRREETGSLRLSVSDNGIGLRPDFDVAGGKGLGMRLVRLLAEGLDGRIEASDAGPGARFSVLLPMPAPRKETPRDTDW